MPECNQNNEAYGGLESYIEQESPKSGGVIVLGYSLSWVQLVVLIVMIILLLWMSYNYMNDVMS